MHSTYITCICTAGIFCWRKRSHISYSAFSPVHLIGFFSHCKDTLYSGQVVSSRVQPESFADAKDPIFRTGSRHAISQVVARTHIFPSFFLFSSPFSSDCYSVVVVPTRFFICSLWIQNLTFTGDGDLQAGDCLSDTTSSRGILARRECS